MKMLKARKLLLVSVAVLSMLDAPALRAQSALDGFDPNANSLVNVVVLQPDGKILIGGAFTTLSPNGGPSVTRNRIARLNPDGTLDTAFNPNASGTVWSIAVQADGKILVGGEFITIGGQARSRIARLDAASGLADSFDPNANNTVRSIVEQPDGKILAGGAFTSIGGQTRNRVARLDATTGVADSFNPNANNLVLGIVAQPGGKILVGGFFTTIGGQTRNNIARLDAGTGLADSFDPNANNPVFAIATQADGKILAGGAFTTIGGQTRNHVARLDPATGLADSFNPNANDLVYTIVPQPDGQILVGGALNLSTIGGQTRNRIARLNPITGLADSFDPNANNEVFAIAVQPDGKVLAGGAFLSVAPNGGAVVPRNRIARLEKDGALDQTLNVVMAGEFPPAVLAIAIQPDGKLLLGGSFAQVQGVARNNIARLNTNGTLDMAFNPNANGEVESIVVQADGRILVGGAFRAGNIGGQFRNYIARLDGATGLADSFNPDANNGVSAIAAQPDGRVLAGGLFNGFNSIGGQARNGIARLDPATGLADSFDPNAGARILTIALQGDGKILTGGFFTSIGGQTRNRIARLDPMTGAADSFDPNASQDVWTIAVQPDGKILVGGNFHGANSIGGQTRDFIARLDSTTGLADSFNPDATSTVDTIALQADGKILVGGNFTDGNSIGGQTRNRIARLDPVTGEADFFDPNANNLVTAIMVQPDGKVLAGGSFTGANSIGGQTRTLIARLSNDSAALQTLSATQSTITWTRGGSSPHLARVTFESSPDNTNYTLLGSGAASGSNWSLTGLNLPVAQNIYIRARGYYRGGVFNSSESITESVRNVFLSAASLELSTAVSRKTHGTAGTFDIPLPLTGEPGVECRSSGGAQTLVFTFNNNVVSGNAAVTTGTGAVSGSPIFAGNAMTVNLIGVTDLQKITVTLSGVTDGAAVLPDTVVSVNMLIGDTNGNKSVSASDVAQTKAASGAAVTGANFRTDINANGTVSATDVGQVKANAGHTLP